jgi:hypothetical protein
MCVGPVGACQGPAAPTSSHSCLLSPAAQHSTAQHSTAQHSTAQHSTAQHTSCTYIYTQQQRGPRNRVYEKPGNDTAAASELSQLVLLAAATPISIKSRLIARCYCLYPLHPTCSLTVGSQCCRSPTPEKKARQAGTCRGGGCHRDTHTHDSNTPLAHFKLLQLDKEPV